MTVNYRYVPGDLVVTPFGSTVMVSICNYGTNGTTYLCMTEVGAYLTFPENQLQPAKETKNNVMNIGGH